MCSSFRGHGGIPPAIQGPIFARRLRPLKKKRNCSILQPKFPTILYGVTLLRAEEPLHVILLHRSITVSSHANSHPITNPIKVAEMAKAERAKNLSCCCNGNQAEAWIRRSQNHVANAAINHANYTKQYIYIYIHTYVCIFIYKQWNTRRIWNIPNMGNLWYVMMILMIGIDWVYQFGNVCHIWRSCNIQRLSSVAEWHKEQHKHSLCQVDLFCTQNWDGAKTKPPF